VQVVSKKHLTVTNVQVSGLLIIIPPYQVLLSRAENIKRIIKIKLYIPDNLMGFFARN
jgi:hypothetical protein